MVLLIVLLSSSFVFLHCSKFFRDLADLLYFVHHDVYLISQAYHLKLGNNFYLVLGTSLFFESVSKIL